MKISKRRFMKYRLILLQSIFFLGIGWIGAKYIALTDVSNSATVTIKFFIVTLSLLPLIIAKRELILSKRGLLVTFIASILMLLIIKSTFLGMKHGYPGMASIIANILPPLLTYILIKIIDKNTLKIKDIFALIIGAVGALIILQIWKLSSTNILNSSNLYFIVCAVLWSLLTILAHKNSKVVSPYQFTFYYSLFASIIMIITNPNFGGTYLHNPNFWVGMFIYAFLGSTVGSLLYFYSAGKLGAAKASSYLYFSPVITIIVSFVLFGETFTLSSIVGVVMIIISLIMIK